MTQLGEGSTPNRGPLIKPLLIAGLLIIGFGIAALLKGLKNAGPVPPQMPVSDGMTATVFEEPGPISPFSLVDHNGQPFTQESLRGHWSILFFGYTYCPDVCPMTLTMMNKVDQLLKEQGDVEIPRYVMVTVDPARDSAKRLGEYVTYFNPAFIGLTGEEEEIARLAKPLGIAYQRDEVGEDGGYSVSHGAALVLINADGQVQAISTPPHDPASIASDYRQIVRSH